MPRFVCEKRRSHLLFNKYLLLSDMDASLEAVIKVTFTPAASENLCFDDILVYICVQKRDIGGDEKA